MSQIAKKCAQFALFLSHFWYTTRPLSLMISMLLLLLLLLFACLFVCLSIAMHISAAILLPCTHILYIYPTTRSCSLKPCIAWVSYSYTAEPKCVALPLTILTIPHNTRSQRCLPSAHRMHGRIYIHIYRRPKPWPVSHHCGRISISHCLDNTRTSYTQYGKVKRNSSALR